MRVPILRGLMIAILTLVVSNGVAFAGPIEDWQAAYNRGDYATALRLIKPLATQGNADAQTNLGFMYDTGLGVPKDDKEAVKWYRLAAAQGNARLPGAAGRGLPDRPRSASQARKWPTSAPVVAKGRRVRFIMPDEHPSDMNAVPVPAGPLACGLPLISQRQCDAQSEEDLR
jgi:hypothetical protein